MQWADIEDDITRQMRSRVLDMPEWLLRTPSGGCGCDFGIGILLDREGVERYTFTSKGRLPDRQLMAVHRPIRYVPTEDPLEFVTPSFVTARQFLCMTPNVWFRFSIGFCLPPRGVKLDSQGQWTVGFAFYEEG